MRKSHLQIVHAAATTRRESIEEQIAERLRRQREVAAREQQASRSAAAR
jgi:hypothetical protein